MHLKNQPLINIQYELLSYLLNVQDKSVHRNKSFSLIYATCSKLWILVTSFYISVQCQGINGVSGIITAYFSFLFLL